MAGAGPAVSGPADRRSRFAGSHDIALEALWTQARRAHPEVPWSAQYVGSLEGLLALLRGEAAIAGSHLLDEESGEFNLPILRRLFIGQRLCVVTLAEREQGLIVAPGNPFRLQGFADLRRPGVRFINRQPGSGTRTLLDFHLRSQGIPHSAVAGYGREVATHLAVASAVADGSADVGLGLLAAARAFGLEFVPLAHERYDLVMRAEECRQPPLSYVVDLVSSPSLQAVVRELGGYSLEKAGQTVLLD
jgi:putative molybdopterin biosynthesis protein